MAIVRAIICFNFKDSNLALAMYSTAQRRCPRPSSTRRSAHIMLTYRINNSDRNALYYGRYCLLYAFTVSARAGVRSWVVDNDAWRYCIYNSTDLRNHITNCTY